MHRFLAFLLVPFLFQQDDVEQRIFDYLKTNVQPGKPVVVSELFNTVFTKPEERKGLERLYNTFFKIPMFMVQYNQSAKKAPTLQELADQFSFKTGANADVVLRIMESDPRVPKFLERDPKTGEILNLDVEKIKADARFSRAIERTIAGWEGKPAPPFSILGYDGQPVASTDLAGKPHLVYIWFTNCPPCVKTSPILTELHKQYSGQGLKIVAANADKFLELPYDDAVRADYVKKLGITFTTAHLNQQMQQAYGGVSVFPTMFFVDKGGLVVRHFVNFQEKAVLDNAVREILR